MNIDQTDVTWSYARPLTWSAVEISIAITCACLPTFQPLVRAVFGRCISRTTMNSHRRRRGVGAPHGELHPSNTTTTFSSTPPTSEFYRLEKRVECNVKSKIVTSVWASKEDLTATDANAKTSILSRRPSEDRGWLGGIHVTREIELESKRGRS